MIFAQLLDGGVSTTLKYCESQSSWASITSFKYSLIKSWLWITEPRTKTHLINSVHNSTAIQHVQLAIAIGIGIAVAPESNRHSIIRPLIMVLITPDPGKNNKQYNLFLTLWIRRSGSNERFFPELSRMNLRLSRAQVHWNDPEEFLHFLKGGFS